MKNGTRLAGAARDKQVGNAARLRLRPDGPIAAAPASRTSRTPSAASPTWPDFPARHRSSPARRRWETISSLYGVIGVMLALRHKEATGRGQVIDVGIYEAVFRQMDELAAAYGLFGKVREREPGQLRRRAARPFGARTASGWRSPAPPTRCLSACPRRWSGRNWHLTCSMASSASGWRRATRSTRSSSSGWGAQPRRVGALHRQGGAGR